MVGALNHWRLVRFACMVSSVLGSTISPERSARIVTDRCMGGVGDQKDRNLVPQQLGWLMFELLYIQSEPLTTFSGSPRPSALAGQRQMERKSFLPLPTNARCQQLLGDESRQLNIGLSCPTTSSKKGKSLLVSILKSVVTNINSQFVQP